MRNPPSLRAQAIIWLAQREHSERELRTKLLRRIAALQRRAALGARGGERRLSPAPAGPPVADSPAASEDRTADDHTSRAAEVDDLIAWLLQRGYLDEHRFVASRVHVRADRFGVARIEQELSRHGLDLPPEAVETLRSTELERAQAVWQRRFGQPPVDIRDAARQARFLCARGFAGEVIRRVVPHWQSENDPDREAS